MTASRSTSRGSELRFALVASLLAAGCAAIGGLGDFKEVDCAGPACGGGADGGGADGGGGGTQPFVVVGGTVTGLKGKGLVLSDNGADNVQIGADGPFTFPAAVRTGEGYEVTVSSQPSSPTQACTVSNGKGTANGVDVTDVKVDCSTAAYAVGGTVVGLSAGTVVLTNNGGDDTSVAANGPFTFATKVASGDPYAVGVKTQPVGSGPCAVSGGTGTMGVGDVGSVVVNCAPGTYTVGGTVTGLDGTVVLQLNGGNNVSLNANGSFAFPKTLAPNDTFAVSVLTQPGYPPRSQTCTVTGGSGTMGSANVTNIAIACTTNSFTVGGNVTGLTGTGLVLKDNGGDALTVNASGAFTFATKVASGSTYAVTIGTQPSGQTCSVASGSGTVTNGNVTGVAVSCGGGADPGIKCGATYCNPATSLCCVTNGTPACASKCSGPGTTPYSCDDAADCQTGLVCCGSVSGSTVNNIYCAAPSLCTSPKAYYCDPGVANPCPNGGTCTATNAPSGYYRCF